MPKISTIGAAMPESSIEKLYPYANDAKQRGIHVFHLNIGQPDIEAPEVALKAVQNFDCKVIAYTQSAGLLSYREKLATYYQNVGINITADDIIVTNGGSEAIQIAFSSCIDHGDEVIVPEPFYGNYNGLVTGCGVKIKPIFSSIENGFALPPIQEFEKLITPKTKAIMICNPSNPTGYLYTKEELEQLKEIVIKHDLFLFSDEVYREFCYDGTRHFSVMELEGLEEHVVLLDSISKRYSVCGARIGVLISRNKEVMHAAMMFAQARVCASIYGQVLGEAACDTPQSYFDRVISDYVARRNCVVEAINKIPGCLCPNPKGAFYTVARLPIDNTDRFCQWLLEEFNYEGKTVMFAPATGFYSEPTKGVDEVRISYCLKVDDLKQAMKCLEEALKVYPGRK